MSAAPAVRAAGLTKDYGRLRAVDRLDLEVPSGCVFGFLGPNGSGKSTTLRMLLGLIRPSAGRVELLGRDVSAGAASRVGVGALVETPAFYEYLSGRRNLELYASLSGRVDPRELAGVLEMVRLTGRERDKVRTYSQGMKARLALAQALLPRPQLLILDEPTNGLDPQGMREVRQLLAELTRERGLTVLISSHLLGEVQQVCDQVAVLQHGRLVAQGAVSALLSGDAGREGPARGARLRVLARPLEAAAAVARALPGVGLVTEAGDALLVEIELERAAELTAALVKAGVAVHGLSHDQRTLEAYFLELTHDEVAL